MTRTRHRAHHAATTAALAALLALAACQGHGKHTQAFKNEAEARMNSVKAATSFDMAQQQFLSGDLEKSLKNIEQSIALNEKVARSHVLRGRVLIELGRLEAALGSLDAALALEEKNADAQYYKGIVHERFSQFGDALGCYKAAAEADPSNPQFAVAAAEMLVDEGRFDEAETLLSPNPSPFQHNAGVRQTLGHIASLRGDHVAAARHFAEALLLAPNDPSILEDLARARFALADHAEAESALRRLLMQPEHSGRADLQHLRARCLVALDRPVEAREILIHLASDQSSAGDADVWLDLGNVSLLLKDGFRLREAGQRLIALAPTRAEGYMFFALWQRDNGKPDAAAKTLERALARVPRDPAPAVLRGMILTDLGRADEARLAYSEALRRDPKNTQASRLAESLNTRQTAELAGAADDQ